MSGKYQTETYGWVLPPDGVKMPTQTVYRLKSDAAKAAKKRDKECEPIAVVLTIKKTDMHL